MVCLVYQEPDAAARIAAQTAVIQTAEDLSVALRTVVALNVVPRSVAPRSVAIRIAVIPNAVIPSVVIPIAVRVGIRVATPVLQPAPLARDARGVELHAAVPQPAQVVRCVARSW